MARKRTNAEAETEIRRLTAENTVLIHALNAAIRHEIEWIHRAGDSLGATYRYGVSNLDSPHGGLFFTRFSAPGQPSSITVDYLDKAYSDCRILIESEYYRLAIPAFEKALNMRYDIWAKQKAEFQVA